MLKHLRNIIKNSSLSLMSLIFTGLIILGSFYIYMAIHLPEVSQLKEMQMQTPLQIFTIDGKFIGEFGEKKRIPVKLNQVPKLLVHAILDTEDQRYYEHKGVDFMSILRAAKAVYSSGKKSQGASTITMQVARNFFLNREKTYTRKINEILLAFKIDSTFSKEEILELYLNKIYMGERAYGVAAAAQIYYGKTLNELTLPQIAMLAGLPQAPSRENPISNPKLALERRNHVLLRMYTNQHISKSEYKAAVTAPVGTRHHELLPDVAAPYVAEMVRTELIDKFGEAIYDSGAKIYTTLEPRIQDAANKALRNGIIAYDRRHGYRGPEGRLRAKHDRFAAEKQLRDIPVINNLHPAAVLSVSDQTIVAKLVDGNVITIDSDGFKWAHLSPINVLAPGNIIRVQKSAAGSAHWELAQVPEIEGALVALNPNTGAIVALNGGFSYGQSNFNRVMQAERQAGSTFKPFIYSAALTKGYTLASVINDAPVVLNNPGSNDLWRPQNDTERFYGPTTLRTALIESRNLVSIRLLQAIEIPYAVDYISKFGFEPKNMPATPSLALGTGIVNPLQMTVGFAVFANGGKKVEPYFIDHIVDRNGKTIFQAMPKPPQQVITQPNAYLMTDVLRDVINRGTARKASAMRRTDLAGKTGTTNDLVDAWFSGFNSDLVSTVWIGYDKPKTIYEHGAAAALPVWMEFMGGALAGKPEHTMAQPAGITSVRIDPATGLLAAPGQRNAVFEKFISNTVPTTQASSADSGSEAEAQSVF